jgi:type VI secretion system secreted protein Hcp
MALVDMFLKVEGADGESPDPKHPGEIQIEGFRLSAMSPRDSETGGASGAVRFSHFSFVSKIDKAAPLLTKKLATNEKTATAILTCRKAGKEQQDYFKITLTNVYVAKVQFVRGEGGDGIVPLCECELAYGTIEIQAREQQSSGPTSGPVMFRHDLQQNR